MRQFHGHGRFRGGRFGNAPGLFEDPEKERLFFVSFNRRRMLLNPVDVSKGTLPRGSFACRTF
jgi:hypothetical protein